MLEIRRGDIFGSGAEALVNPVNCVGVMGRGLAREFRRRYADNYRRYHQVCGQGMLHPGGLFVTEREANPRYIVNLATKGHWRDPSRIEYVKTGLGNLSGFIVEHPDISIAVPALGAGLGQLEWSKVRPLMEEVLGAVSDRATVYIFEPL